MDQMEHQTTAINQPASALNEIKMPRVGGDKRTDVAKKNMIGPVIAMTDTTTKSSKK